MGKYLNKMPDGTDLPKIGKADKLLTVKGAWELDKPPNAWCKDLVFVAENRGGYEDFDAAAYACDENEMEYLKRGSGDRKIRWLIIPDAEKLVSD